MSIISLDISEREEYNTGPWSLFGERFMRPVRFLHAADIHLGRPFSGIKNRNGVLWELFVRAGMRAWHRLVDTAVHEAVDCVTLAGDIFDRADPPLTARLAFRDGIRKLYDRGIPVYASLGNHDALDRFPEHLASLPGLHVFGPTPETVEVPGSPDGLRTAVVGAGFAQPAVTDNLALGFERPEYADVAIGLLHTNVGNIEGHNNYAPCSVRDLRASGMDVWCLGHVHEPRLISEDPLIVYPGTIQGASIVDRGRRGCYLIEVNESRCARARFVDLAGVRWESLDITLHRVTTEEETIDAIERRCMEWVADMDSCDAVVIRITLRTGANTAYSPDELEEILGERLAELPVPVYPESLRIENTVDYDLDAFVEEEDFIGEFARLVRECIADPDKTAALLEAVERDPTAPPVGRYLDGPVHGSSVLSNRVDGRSIVEEAAHIVLSAFLNTKKDG